jgi:hypothetical protein
MTVASAGNLVCVVQNEEANLTEVVQQLTETSHR